MDDLVGLPVAGRLAAGEGETDDVAWRADRLHLEAPFQFLQAGPYARARPEDDGDDHHVDIVADGRRAPSRPGQLRTLAAGTAPCRTDRLVSALPGRLHRRETGREWHLYAPGKLRVRGLYAQGSQGHLAVSLTCGFAVAVNEPVPSWRTPQVSECT